MCAALNAAGALLPSVAVASSIDSIDPLTQAPIARRQDDTTMQLTIDQQCASTYPGMAWPILSFFESEALFRVRGRDSQYIRV